jgi:hypothetical protein
VRLILDSGHPIDTTKSDSGGISLLEVALNQEIQQMIEGYISAHGAA